MIKVSVIVATYNDEEFIARCLRSLQNQHLDIQEYEIIVINDGSTDKTKFALEVLKKPSDNNFKIINNYSNLGLASSVNKGISAAKGEYIVRVDADDFVNINFLSILSFYLDMNQDTGAVECDYLIVDESENIIEKISCQEFPIACGIMFRKKYLLDIGMYDSKFRCNEEKDLRIRFTKKYKIDYLNLPLYRYRKHSTNMTNNKSILKIYNKLLNKKHALDK